MKKLLSVIMLLSVMSLFVACQTEPTREKKFSEGQVIRMKIDGRKGMVTDVWNMIDVYCYTVRIPCDGIKTDTKIMSEDGMLKTVPYLEIRVEEFEIEPWVEDSK